MQRSISALRPWFGLIAASSLTPAYGSELRQLGIDAEKAMLAATGGVNTHRGAIFALGLAIAAASAASAPDQRSTDLVDYQDFMRTTMGKLSHSLIGNSLNNSEFQRTHKGTETDDYLVKGAREMALEGYKELFESWLPYYRSVKGQPYDRQRTLLLIMSTLDDTCVIKRAGYDRAQQVKQEAANLLNEAADLRREIGCSESLTKNNFPQLSEGLRRQQTEVFHSHLTEFCKMFATEGISCGGAADMLALTIFIDTITS